MWHRSLVAGGAACILSVAALRASAQDHEGHHDAPPRNFGSVNFRNSGNAAAQEPFQRGVALLHSFVYREAARAFQEAQAADSTLALAYWLEAFTYSHVVWGEESLDRSRAVLTRLGPTPAARLARAKTSREQAIGAAIEAFYADTTLPVRARTYSDALQQLVAVEPRDLEVSALAAHAAMMAWFTSPPAARGNLAEITRGLALKVFTANPQHPGAAHYLTHIADMDPKSASTLMVAARAYDRIAPDAEHALHMPSHVYLPLGMWPEISSANERSWAASRAAVARNGLSPTALSWHSLEWLQYAYLQQGRWRDARALIDTAYALLRNQAPGDNRPDARFAVNVLAFAYGRETGDWTAWPTGVPDAGAILSLPMPTARAVGMTRAAGFQAAVGALMARNDRATAMAASQRLKAVADTMSTARKPDVMRMATQLDALLAASANDPRIAAALLRPIMADVQSASLPPTNLVTAEILGNLLLAMDQPVDAAAAFRAALAAHPNRSQALLGLARALSASGDRAGAEQIRQQLRVNWKTADPAVLKSAGL